MKQTEVTKVTIDEVNFYIKPFPAFTAANLSGDLSALLSPILASFVAVLNGVKEEDKGKVFDIGNVEVEKVVPMLSSAFKSLNGNELESLAKKLLITYDNISYDDENGNLRKLDKDAVNEIFCGSLDGMFTLCYEVLKVNYKGFFSKIGSQFGDLKMAVQSSMNINTEN